MNKFLITVMIVILVSFGAYAVNPKKYLKGGNIPVHITADKLTAFDKKGLYIFEGNVVATRGDVRLKADKMKIYKDLKSGDIEKIVCLGHVVITKEDKKAEADKATYYAKKSMVVLEGNATVLSGKNNIKADRIVYYLDKDYVVSQSDNPKKRVEVTIYPSKKEKK